MSFLTNILYLLSTSLLIPVIVLLIYFFVKALISLGAFFSHLTSRLKQQNSFKNMFSALKEQSIASVNLKEHLKTHKNSFFVKYFRLLIQSKWHPIHCKKIFSDGLNESYKKLNACKRLIRLGPMFGLMGTLIPLGPALVGLASGDIKAMALNIQVAFATTVLGVATGAIAYLIHSFEKNWYDKDLEDLEYVYELYSSHKEGELN